MFAIASQGTRVYIVNMMSMNVSAIRVITEQPARILSMSGIVSVTQGLRVCALPTKSIQQH